MKVLCLIFLITICSCAKPKGSIFLDESLKQEENVKFCFTGDMGMDTPHQQAIADALKREKCHRLFFLGDLVYPKGIDSVEDEELTTKFLSYYEPLFEDNPNLFINLVLGNHDHKGKPEAWKDISKKNDHFFFPDYYYMVDYGGICFVALDSSFYYYLNDVFETSAQTSWLQGLRARLKKCDVKVAMTHHPFKSTGHDPNDDWEGAEGALKVFLDSYVIGTFDIHFAGHVHAVFDDGKDEGTRMLTSGAGGQVRGDNKPGYIVLNWQPSNPKRVGYVIKYIDVVPTIVDESIERQEDHLEPEHIINKYVVESGIFNNIWKIIKSVFY
ncbi:MAG TPA: metallophosphoesterase [Bacteriovoracaceae bacterium]|nr:metallophosphoesterase [Bacteriovoracaceae bacterium]